MCGRYSLTASSETLIQHFDLKSGLFMAPRYNIAPSQLAPVLKVLGQIDFLQWGIIPGWMSEKPATPFINARSETVSQKPSFRAAFTKRRCLVVADGYYEWKLVGKIKQPYYIRPSNGSIIAFAGIWENETFSILTKEAEPLLSEIHQRMPIIIPQAAYQLWLKPVSLVENEIEKLFHSVALPTLEYYPVTIKVNSPRFDTPECIEKLK